jgi:hypothetical protein
MRKSGVGEVYTRNIWGSAAVLICSVTVTNVWIIPVGIKANLLAPRSIVEEPFAHEATKTTAPNGLPQEILLA